MRLQDLWNEDIAKMRLRLQDLHFKYRIKIQLTNEWLTTLHIAGEYGANVVVNGIFVVVLSSLVPFAVNKINICHLKICHALSDLLYIKNQLYRSFSISHLYKGNSSEDLNEADLQGTTVKTPCQASTGPRDHSLDEDEVELEPRVFDLFA